MYVWTYKPRTTIDLSTLPCHSSFESIVIIVFCPPRTQSFDEIHCRTHRRASIFVAQFSCRKTHIRCHYIKHLFVLSTFGSSCRTSAFLLSPRASPKYHCECLAYDQVISSLRSNRGNGTEECRMNVYL